MQIGFGGLVEFRAKIVSAPVTKRDGRGEAYWSFSVNDDEYEYPEGYNQSKALDPVIDVSCSKTHSNFAGEMAQDALCYVCGYPDISKEDAAPFGGKMRIYIWKLRLPNGDWI